jgi:3-deoxy-D-manno-octulosonic-acid transferase
MTGSAKKPQTLEPDALEFLARDAAYVGMLAAWSPALLCRIAKGKYRKGWGHKLGFVPQREALSPPEGRIWIHAVSVGEAVVAATLAEALRAERDRHEIVVSTTTPTGQEVARKRFGKDMAFYLPLDFSGPVRRAFRRTKPNVLVLMELEIWPNLVATAEREGVPVVVVNGRISSESLPRYRRVKRFLKTSMERVAVFGVQTEAYAERFREIGAPPERVVVTGSLKYDGVKTEPDPEVEAWARSELRVRSGERLLLGGSTHRTEEEALARAWRDIGAAEPWRLVVVPRHPPRIPEVEAELARAGFRTVRRTATKGNASVKIDRETIILVDTVGELGRFYHAADLVFVGGSLIPHGGQNPIEPAGIGRPVIHGPHTFNFQETIELLREARGTCEVGSPEELGRAVRELAADEPAREQLGSAAREAILSRQGAASRSAGLVLNALARGGTFA